ncbi:hypothetical protein [Amycolatopsis anabasis]|uniref:hypothetical protein n=1 Tax=Amycolatopsis anabasis TaxID=1840409 RepID=UPI00131E9913|nr:hypothetical protein [Amycolatopsis anabasis]
MSRTRRQAAIGATLTAVAASSLLLSPATASADTAGVTAWECQGRFGCLYEDAGGQTSRYELYDCGTKYLPAEWKYRVSSIQTRSKPVRLYKNDGVIGDFAPNVRRDLYRGDNDLAVRYSIPC